MVRPAGCIKTAATLRQTAAAAAKVKSDIHMTAIPSPVSAFAQIAIG